MFSFRYRKSLLGFWVWSDSQTHTVLCVWLPLLQYLYCSQIVYMGDSCSQKYGLLWFCSVTRNQYYDTCFSIWRKSILSLLFSCTEFSFKDALSALLLMIHITSFHALSFDWLKWLNSPFCLQVEDRSITGNREAWFCITNRSLPIFSSRLPHIRWSPSSARHCSKIKMGPYSSHNGVELHFIKECESNHSHP